MAVELSDRKKTLLGIPEDLLGFNEYPQLPYPDTPLALTNAIQRDALLARRAEAAEAAAADADYAANEREEEIDFERNTRLGFVVKPKFQTLRGYKWMLRQGDGVRNIEFSPHDYSAFDGIIVERSGLDEERNSTSAAFNPNHPHYQDFSPLRRNIAILRNYLAVQLFETGEDSGNAKKDNKANLEHYRMLNDMADRLGSALASDSGKSHSFISRWVKTVTHFVKGEDLSTPYTNDFMKAANVPDKGVATMYNFLYGLKENKGIKDIFSKKTPAHWPLKPREQTAFSDENLEKFSRSSQMVAISDAYENKIMKELRAPENLTVDDRATSIQLAEEILEKLRNLMANPDTQEKLSQFTDEDHDKSRKLLQVASGFRNALAVIQDADPEALMQNKIIAQSFNALEQLGYRQKMETHRMLIEEYEPKAAKHVKKAMDETPSEYKTNSSTESLLTQVQSGLKEAARIQAQARMTEIIRRRSAQRAAAQLNAQRVVNNAQQQSKAGSNAIKNISNNSKFKDLNMGSGQTFSSGNVRGATREAAGSIQATQERLYAEAQAKDKARADAPMLNDTRGR